MAKHKLRGAQYYTFLPIPHALRYEVNCLGDVRNRKTGYILKWYLNPHNTKQLTLIDNHGKKITATFPHLLWLVHGQLKGKCSAVPVTIEKGYRRLRFDSMSQCASFLVDVTKRTQRSVWAHLVHRHKSIDDWEISYFR